MAEIILTVEYFTKLADSKTIEKLTKAITETVEATDEFSQYVNVELTYCEENKK